MPTPAPSQSPPTCGGAAATTTTAGAHSGVSNRPLLNAVMHSSAALWNDELPFRPRTSLAPGEPNSLLWLTLAVPEAARLGAAGDTSGTQLGNLPVRNALFELARRHMETQDDPSANALVDGQHGWMKSSAVDGQRGVAELFHRSAQHAERADGEVERRLERGGAINWRLAQADEWEWIEAIPEVLRRWPGAERFVHERKRRPVRECVQWALRHQARLAEDWSRAMYDVVYRHRQHYRDLEEQLELEPGVPLAQRADHDLRVLWALQLIREPREPRKSEGPVPPLSEDDLVRNVLHNGYSTPMVWARIAAQMGLSS